MPSHRDERATVHVVDDDASMRGALEALFDLVGLATETYAAARDFLATSPADQPGCMVIDIRLPDMNGLDFQARLVEVGTRLPVVMMTGHGDISMSVRAMKSGAVDFLSKPFKDQDMLDAVMAAIDRDRQRREADGDRSQMQQRFQNSFASGIAGDAVGDGRQDEQTGSGRSGDQRNHRKNSSRGGYAKDGRADSCRPCPDGRSGETQGVIKGRITPAYSLLKIPLVGRLIPSAFAADQGKG